MGSVNVKVWTRWAVLALAAAGVLLPAATLEAQTPVFVELKSPAPTVVARYEAQQAGQPFDAELHRASIRLAQDNFLNELTAAGVIYQLTNTTALVAGVEVNVADRYTELINAVRLSVTGEDVRRVRDNPNVAHITVDEPLRLTLDHSAPYIRANGPDSARSRGVRGAGQVGCDGSSTGQVVAVLDTGIDHTNPMFDSRFTDAQFEQRSGDLRPVRLQGTPFLCDPLTGEPLNHPKVAYRFLFQQMPVLGDDTGHGTNTSSAAAGLRARADSTLNQGEIVEGVAPGAVLMDYKVCPSLACVGQQIQMSLQDAAMERDLAGFPKPRATVVNMSFGDDDPDPNVGGNPNSANAVAAGN
ncbi:MAG: S8 family serine peptidase, partial [Candidatus Acidiferrales bacterium]